MTKSVKELKDAICPLLQQGAKLTDEHLVEIGRQISVMNQGIAALSGGPGLGTAVPAETTGMPTGTTGMPTGIPNPGGPSMPAYPFGGPASPPAGIYGATAPMTPGHAKSPRPAGPVSSGGLMQPPPPPPSMGVMKHIFYMGKPNEKVSGPLLGVAVPNQASDCIYLQHEVTHSIRSCSPTPYSQVRAQSLAGTVSPKGWAVSSTGHVHRVYSD